MSDFVFGGISAVAVVFGFAYFVLRAVFVPKEKFDADIRALEKRINDRDLITQQEHNKLATKSEVDKLESAFGTLVEKVNASNKELDAKITTLQNGLWWLIAKAGGKEDTIQKLFRVE